MLREEEGVLSENRGFGQGLVEWEFFREMGEVFRSESNEVLWFFDSNSFARVKASGLFPFC